jgi:hypothetical protein
MIGSDNEESTPVLATTSQVITPWTGAQAIIAGNRYPATSLQIYAGEGYIDVMCVTCADNQTGYIIIADQNPTLTLEHGVMNNAALIRFLEWTP